MMNLLTISLIPLFLCWGSFLNGLAYRLLHNVSILYPRSYCPHCRHTLAWYDLIPLFSWLILKGACRYCHKSISWLYPFIEVFTVIALSLLFMYVPLNYFFGYFIFFSALIVSIRTDLAEMLISRYATLFLIPAGCILSYLELLPLTMMQSIVGALVGYGLLYLIAALFYRSTKKEGLGQGDMDLLSFIGAFTGIYGCWISLLLASVFGSLIGIIYLNITKQNTQVTRIPFGPFLALGAMGFVLFKPWLLLIILGIEN